MGDRRDVWTELVDEGIDNLYPGEDEDMSAMDDIVDDMLENLTPGEDE